LQRGDRLRLAGALLFAGAAQFVPGMTIAEALYPGYSVSAQPISDLGATCMTVSGVRTCTLHQPSATIFDASVLILGLLALLGASFVFRAGNRALGVTLMLGGVGAMGVGVFSETTGALHLAFAFVAFLFAGISAVLSYKSARPPLSYFSLVLGAVTLLALALYASSTYLGLGQGGMERMIVYPALIWIAGYGAYLMGHQEPI
jgi:hypothetical membrane protein